MNEQVAALKQDADEARYLYRIGAITRKEACSRIEPYANVFNKKSKELAMKYNQRHKPFSLSAYLR